ncbi:MAG TPA: GGDEF domain-containing protein [Longimicrobium sp.]|jgi:diguanylate cyclase (GGDEF)-like protein|uniref:GGDEF domain-containing protein n=1 Tax=Longimicrobium sp. TaxID=2029185 RepID=UPI002EDB39FC
MTDPAIGGLISFLGALTQGGGTVLLAGLFAVLTRANPRRPYFRLWALGWPALAVALTAVLAFYVTPERVSGPLAARVADGVYQAGKLLFFACLLGGTLSYVAGTQPRRFLRLAAPFALGYALLSALVTVSLNTVVLMQTPVAAAACALCGALLLRLPPSRSTLGSRATGAVFCAMAVLWAGYAAGYLTAMRAGLHPVDGPLGLLLQYNSYLDLLAQMLLAFGMVLLLMEDARREADDARAQLSVSHDRLLRVALHDSLTGALNRRAYEEGVGLDAVGARFGTAVMLDMDNLKTVNDVHGHGAGDELLRRLVQTLRGCIRPLDRVYRWGGDEFLLLFPAALPADVVPRIREALVDANRQLAPEDRGRLQLLLSMGAADYSGAEDLPAAIARADAAMYREKSAHRSARPAQHPASAAG